MSTAFEDMYRGSASGVVAESAKEAFDAAKMLKEIDRSAELADGAEYPNDTFGNAMRQIARLIKADAGVEIAFAEVGGWDTHVNQGGATGQLAFRFNRFARTLRAFAQDLGGRLADVVVLTMSEFGRTVAENGSAGTDHGHGTAMMIFGGGTRGGRVLGRWPGLDPESRFEGRDLSVTTDFRDLFGEILVRHLDAADLSAIFPGYTNDAKRWPGVLA